MKKLSPTIQIILILLLLALFCWITNPAKGQNAVPITVGDTIFIRPPLTDFTLYNLHGTIMCRIIEKGYCLTNNLQPGVYVYSVYLNGEKVTGKFLVE